MTSRAQRFALLAIVLMAAPDIHASTKDDLAATREQMEKAKAKQEKLESQQQDVEKELQALQKKLVKAAASLQQTEKQVADAEANLAALAEQLANKKKNLHEQQTKLDGLARIAIRISRTPPQAMILMPGDGTKRLQASQALSVLTADMEREAASIRKQLEELAVLKEKMEEKKAIAEKLRTAALSQKKAFEDTLKTRKKLRDSLASDSKKEAEKVAKLAQRAGSLEGLMASLSRSEKVSRDKASPKDVRSASGVAGKRGSLRSFEAARGNIRIPASGKLIGRFGESDKDNDTSKGITITTSRGATVVAPYDAEVVYTGPFLNYGRLVILKHRGDYHTLLAGLERIDVNNGDFLLEGEPIGAMSGNGKRDLYVELRENNQPVDPANWMHGL